jgi:perosamine synthetase
MKIKFPFGQPILSNSENYSIKKVLDSKILVHGPITSKFEDLFKKFTKAKEAVSVSSCTAGMHLVYFALGIGKGDEIIVPAQTHISTAHAVELTGAKAVFVDCDLKTGNILASDIEKKINRKTKAIAIVHFLGIPVDISEIKKIAKKNNLFILEDCALAIGAKYNNKHVGTIGDVGVFSFYPVKHFTTGEGGIIITKNKKLSKKLKLLRAFGVNKTFSERKKGLYNSNYLGLNYRMSEIHAAIGCSQIKKLPSFLKQRKINFDLMYKKISNNKKIQVIKSNNKFLQSSNYCLSIILRSDISKKRDEIIKKLNKEGLGTSIYYPHPVPRMNYYKNKYKYDKKNFKNATIISDNSIALPVGPHLKQNQIIKISKIINNILEHYE